MRRLLQIFILLAIGALLALTLSHSVSQESKTEPIAAGFGSNLPPFVGAAVSPDSSPEPGPRVISAPSNEDPASEIEIAVSTSGQHVVIVTNNGYAFSHDGGQTLASEALPTGLPFARSGDPSVAFGKSGTFYYSLVNGEGSVSKGKTIIAVSTSTDNGRTFTFKEQVAFCDNGDGSVFDCFPDQSHLAADRFNAATGGGDQVYVAWRHITPSGSDAAIRCSKDSGNTWEPFTIIDPDGIHPRVTVGQDGFVYVVYDFENSTESVIKLSKYSPCDSGLTKQTGFPVTVVKDPPSRFDVCPIPGIDRCDGFFVSSPMVAVGTRNPKHIYLAYAVHDKIMTDTENILVRDSMDGGLTWPDDRVVQVNEAVKGRRFMPWVCSAEGSARVSWYDRRAAVGGSSNDLTEYYSGRAFLDDMNKLVSGEEFKISKVADPQCASGWPRPPRDENAAKKCSMQPQLAGRCCAVPLDEFGNCPMGSGARCDFSGGGCPTGETCKTGPGRPKYGDYNGNSCAAGRFFAAWASATSPPEVTPPTPPNRIDTFFYATPRFDLCLSDGFNRFGFNPISGVYCFTTFHSFIGTGFNLTGQAQVRRQGSLLTLQDARITATIDMGPIAPLNRGDLSVHLTPVGSCLKLTNIRIIPGGCACGF